MATQAFLYRVRDTNPDEEAVDMDIDSDISPSPGWETQLYSALSFVELGAAFTISGFLRWWTTVVVPHLSNHSQLEPHREFRVVLSSDNTSKEVRNWNVLCCIMRAVAALPLALAGRVTLVVLFKLVAHGHDRLDAQFAAPEARLAGKHRLSFSEFFHQFADAFEALPGCSQIETSWRVPATQSCESLVPPANSRQPAISDTHTWLVKSVRGEPPVVYFGHYGWACSQLHSSPASVVAWTPREQVENMRSYRGADTLAKLLSLPREGDGFRAVEIVAGELSELSSLPVLDKLKAVATMSNMCVNNAKPEDADNLHMTDEQVAELKAVIDDPSHALMDADSDVCPAMLRMVTSALSGGHLISRYQLVDWTSTTRAALSVPDASIRRASNEHQATPATPTPRALPASSSTAPGPRLRCSNPSCNSTELLRACKHPSCLIIAGYQKYCCKRCIDWIAPQYLVGRGAGIDGFVPGKGLPLCSSCSLAVEIAANAARGPSKKHKNSSKKDKASSDEDRCAMCDVGDELMPLVMCCGCDRWFHGCCHRRPFNYSAVPVSQWWTANWLCDDCESVRPKLAKVFPGVSPCTLPPEFLQRIYGQVDMSSESSSSSSSSTVVAPDPPSPPDKSLAASLSDVVDRARHHPDAPRSFRRGHPPTLVDPAQTTAPAKEQAHRDKRVCRVDHLGAAAARDSHEDEDEDNSPPRHLRRRRRTAK